LNSLLVVNKSELESKHLAELHTLAAEAGIERYRMLGRAELIEKLSDGSGGDAKPAASRPSRSQSGRPRRGREGRPRRQEKPREQKPREKGDSGEGGRRRRSAEPREERDRKPREERERKPRERRDRGEPRAAEQPPPPPAESAATSAPPPSERPKRRRRRRRWGRRRKGIRVHDLLLPAAGGRQAIVYAESRETCTALLREVAADLADASKGPDPIAVLIDPSPEELADWRRDAPHSEIVAAGKANHADDAIAQAVRRAEGGENVIVLIDSLSRFAESYGDADGARDLLNTALGSSRSTAGTLTIVAAVERPS
jgi:hypothetical protein